MTRTHLYAFPCTLLALAFTSPALAASQEEIAKAVCSDRKEEGKLTISRNRLASQIERADKIFLDELAPPGASRAQQVRALQARTRTTENELEWERIRFAQETLREFEEQLGANQFTDHLSVSGGGSRDRGWLFASDKQDYVLTCKLSKEKSILAKIAAPPDRKRLSLREKPEELGLTGKSRKAASAFALGLEQKWTTDSEGAETEETTLKFNGTAGLRLNSKESPLTAYAFAQYNLNQVRKDPAPALLEGQRRDKDDTNVLSLGLSSDFFAQAGEFQTLWITGQAAYVQDFVDEANRVRISTKVDPGLLTDLGICSLGRIKFYGKSTKTGARCLARFDTEVGLWTKDGISTTNTYDDFLAVGANLSFELFFNTGEKNSVIASVNYRYLPVISGELDDIERLELSLAHRIWTDSSVGFDLLTKYNKGTNALSLAEEENLSLGVGVVF